MKKIYLIPAAVAALLLPRAIRAEVSSITADTQVNVVAQGVTNLGALADNDASTVATLTTGKYVTWTAQFPYVLTSYTITGGPDANKNPRTWVLEGSDDGVAWVQIDRKTSQSIAAGAVRTIPVADAKQLPYRRFRFKVEQVKDGGTQCNVAELHLMGEKSVMPAAPTDIRMRFADGKVQLAWRDNADNEDSYLVERTFNGFNWTEVATLPADATSCDDTNAPAGVGVIYRVSARKRALGSDYLTTGVITTGNLTPLTDVAVNLGGSASGTTPINDGENGAKAFDGDINTKYLSTQLPAILTVTLPEPVAVKQYAMISANDAVTRDPKNWVLEASNDGSRWVEIDSKKDQAFAARFQTNLYALSNTEAYRYYRIRVTANRGETLTQFAELALYADIPARGKDVELSAPTNVKLNVRTYNQVEVMWTDNNSSEDCYVVQRSTDGENWTRDYITRANDTRCYPYALKPNTTYYFRVAAKAGEKLGPWSEVATCTTPGDEWPETWPNFDFDRGYHTGNLVCKYTNDDIAVFVNPADVNAEGVSMVDLDISWMYEPYTKMWVAIRETYKDSYGEYLVSDPKLYIVPHYHADGGGLGRLYQYRDYDQLYRNIVHISVGKNSGWRWERNPGNAGPNFLYDVMSHESGHIIEGIGSGKKNSPFYPVWLDSKWAEIFQYDIYGKMDPYHQQAWHREYMQLGKHSEQKPAPGAEWYAKWLYPTYRDFGGDQLFLRFFALLGEHYAQRNGELQGDGNLGEYIHFMSGAAGHDVSSYAKDAFGWNDEWALQLEAARNRYPGVTYAAASTYVNLISRAEAELTTTAPSSSTIDYLRDGLDNTEFDSATKNTDVETVELTYRDPLSSAAVDKLSLTVGTNKTARPASVALYGSHNGKEWTEIFADADPQYSAENTYVHTLATPAQYTYFKLALGVTKSKYQSLKLTEWEMYGQLLPAIPSGLRGEWNSDRGVTLTWSAPYKGIDSFEIERSTNGGEFVKVGETDVMTLSFTDAEALPGAVYNYRVREIGPDFTSPYSDVLTVSTSQSGVQAIEATPATVGEMLDSNPATRVTFRNIAGAVMLSECGMTSSRWQALCSGAAELGAGVYIVNVEAQGARPLHLKVAVK